MTAVSFGTFLPHLLWLHAHGYPTFAYARHRMVETWPQLIGALGNYTFGAIAFVMAPLILLAVLVRPTKAALRNTLFPPEGDRRLAAMIFWVPLLAPIPLALATSTGINSLWTMSALSLFGAVLLSSPRIRLRGSSAAAIAMAAMATGACALLASPIVAAWEHFSGIENYAAYTRRLAPEVSRIWRETTPVPMPYVSSDAAIVNSVAFYMDGSSLAVVAVPANQPLDENDRRHEKIQHRLRLPGRRERLHFHARRHRNQPDDRPGALRSPSCLIG
jgi:hypothetical protein